jgi:hypothetical protein
MSAAKKARIQPEEEEKLWASDDEELYADEDDPDAE